MRHINSSYRPRSPPAPARPTDAAQFIRRGDRVVSSMSTEHFLAVAEYLRQGTTWEPVICVRADG
ncbi:hypothetical protein BWI15_02895 [Kribbella sp. ALI-6-A]|uniref:hypothetical protein n=1 Tax=Kribbella sp. ALI-6-A TaxID=1933817 RepID=UPI00097C002C|nr:hypothetical protein [Kribbella sp. ALI-6-A]ONI77476.1 hypothetical protein BWI15_02895 [Kribbella sp. ALI-6-A]